MIGLALVLLYVAVACGLGDTNLGTAVHGGADFLFWWYLICSSIGTFLLMCIGLGAGGVSLLPETKDRAIAAFASMTMFFLALWVMFRTALLTIGCYLISLGVPVESNVEDWNWTKTGIGIAMILFTLIVLRGKSSNTETKTEK